MSSNSLTQLAGIAIFVVISALVLVFIDRPWRGTKAPFRRPWSEPAPDAPAPLKAFDDKLDQMFEAYDEARIGDSAETRFREQAKTLVEPLLKALVRRAEAHGARAAYDLRINDGAAEYRLQIKRPDHPAGEPPPYISLSRGSDGGVSVQHGGTFPAHEAHAFKNAEIGWRDRPWSAVEQDLLKFANAVFKIYHSHKTLQNLTGIDQDQTARSPL